MRIQRPIISKVTTFELRLSRQICQNSRLTLKNPAPMLGFHVAFEGVVGLEAEGLATLLVVLLCFTSSVLLSSGVG